MTLNQPTTNHEKKRYAVEVTDSAETTIHGLWATGNRLTLLIDREASFDYLGFTQPPWEGLFHFRLTRIRLAVHHPGKDQAKEAQHHRAELGHTDPGGRKKLVRGFDRVITGAQRTQHPTMPVPRRKGGGLGVVHLRGRIRGSLRRRRLPEEPAPRPTFHLNAA